MPRVYAPVKAFTGFRAGVAFCNGVGTCDNLDLLAWFEARGYTVEAVQEGVSKPESKALSKMTRDDLLAYAAEQGISVDLEGKKAVILAAIEAAQATSETEPEAETESDE